MALLSLPSRGGGGCKPVALALDDGGEASSPRTPFPLSPPPPVLGDLPASPSCLTTIKRAILKSTKQNKTDCNVHPLDTEATAAARIARCSQLAPAALTAIDKVSPVVEPPELMARRKANNAAAAAAAAAAGGMGGGGGANGDAAPGPAA